MNFEKKHVCLIFGDGEKFDIIVSNPPYIKTSALASLLPELSFEPRTALDGGDDGMAFYRPIIENFSRFLLPGGAFIFEIGYDQAEKISALAAECGFSAHVAADLSGLPRAAVLRRREG